MPPPIAPPLELDIFVAGKRPALDGREIEITESNLDEVVRSYDPKRFRAPLIVNRDLSHSTAGFSDRELATAPICHGIPSSLKRVGKTLKATFEKHTPELRRWISEGRIPGLSASFYLPDSPSNPYPGQWALRHVAAVMRPAVKGMGLPGFAETTVFGTIAEFGLGEDEGFVEFGCGCGGSCGGQSPKPYGDMMYSPPTLESVLRPLRDYFIEQGGVELANRVLPEHLFRAIDMAHASMASSIESMHELLESKDAELSDMRLKLSIAQQNIARIDGRCDLTNSRIDGLVSEIEGDMEEESMTSMTTDPYAYTSSYSEPVTTWNERSGGSDWVRRSPRNSAALNFLRGQARGSN